MVSVESNMLTFCDGACIAGYIERAAHANHTANAGPHENPVMSHQQCEIGQWPKSDVCYATFRHLMEEVKRSLKSRLVG